MKITIFGCGASMGTPAGGGFWGECDPHEPRNERTRASIMIEGKDTRLIVDATYDLRQQLNRHTIQNVDGLLLSHAHSDHINGVDDLRAISYRSGKMIDTYLNRETLGEMQQRFPYLFATDHDVYSPFIRPHVIEDDGRFRVGGLEIESFTQDHRVCTSLGFRIEDFAYSVDVMDLTKKSLNALKGVETWIVDAAAYHKDTMTTHANLKRVMGWVDLLKPKMTYLTVLSVHMDYKTLCDELPPHIRPLWDGQEIELGAS